MIGILYICTGKYHIFWKDFYLSAQQYLLPGQEKTYFIFTDAEEIYDEKLPHVKKIYQKSMGWPYNTLMRFHVFSKVKSHLQKCEYLFFINANTKFVDVVGEEILPGREHGGLMGVIHPGFWNKTGNEFTYERNPESEAYIEQGLGNHYYMGAFNGGMTDAYLELVDALRVSIDKDLEKGIIAEWWDESHLNRYFLDKEPLSLSPSYLYFEDYHLPFEPKLEILDKVKYGGHAFLRGQ